MRRLFLALFVSVVMAGGGAQAGLLETIKERGNLECGTNTGLAGFAEISDTGEWTGFDIDFCRALAAAIFGDPSKVDFTPLNTQERFTALQSGEIDVLMRNTSWTFSRDTNLGLDFAGISYYDGQGFMVPRSLGVETALDLDGARICVQTGTTTELNVADYFRANGMEFETIVVRTVDESRANYLAEACDAYTTDVSALAAVRTTFPDPSAHMILPEVISKEPLGPAIRHGDQDWADVVRWVLLATILAEELGVTAENVATLKDSATNPEIRRLLGSEGALGGYLGLSDDWAFRVISTVGNYGQIFERGLGKDSTLNLERGLNRLWTDGGLHYAPPLR